MILEKYIQQLLKENDEVVVPKLGTFVAGYAGTEISGTTLAPPKKKIHFYEKLKSDKNELLRKRVTEAEGISISDFQEKLDSFVHNIEQNLDNSSQAHIEGLGTIHKKPDGSLHFEQQNNENLLDDAFGLAPIERIPLDKRKKDDNAPLPVDTPDMSKEEDEKSNHEAPVGSMSSIFEKDPVEARLEQEAFDKATSEVENPPSRTTESDLSQPLNDEEANDDEEEEEEDSKTPLIAWIIAVPILFLFVFLIYLYTQPEAMASFKALFGGSSSKVTELPVEETPTDNFNEQTTDNTLTDNTNNETTAEDSQNDNIDNNTDKDNTSPNAANEPTNINSDTQPADIINEPRNRFYLVIGSFAEIENARKLRQKLQNEGTTDAKIVMYPKRGMYRVTVGDQATEREAYNQRLKVLNSYPDTWVLNY